MTWFEERRMASGSVLGALAALFLLGAAPGVRADQIAVEAAPPPVPFLLRPAPAVESGAAVDGALEASAVEPIGDGRLLLVADDKTNGLVVVEAATGLRVGPPLASRAFPTTEAKWEAMARDDDNNFYVIGSHSGLPADLAAHSFLLRFRLTGGGADGAPLAIDEASVRRWDIADAFGKAGLYNGSDPTKNRLKIEGLAVRTRGSGGSVRRELVIGLRQPDDPITAYAADVTTLPAGNARLALRPLFSFAGGTRESVRSQLSSLEYVAAWRGFLIVTSSEDADNHYHGNTLWFLPDAGVSETSPVAPQRVWLFGVGIKAEGICALPMGASDANDRTIRFALVYDNDAARTRLPSLLQIVTLARWRE